MFALSLSHTLIGFHTMTRTHRHAVVHVKSLLARGGEGQKARSRGGGWHHCKVNGTTDFLNTL